LPALPAALRLILKAFIGKKLLLSHRKYELAAAVLAGQHLLFQRSNLQRVRRNNATPTRQFLRLFALPVAWRPGCGSNRSLSNQRPTDFAGG
jgi:hypothetical protein